MASAIADWLKQRIGPAVEGRHKTLPFEDGTVRSGVCNICGSTEGFCHTSHLHPRENYICLACTSTSRDRMLIAALGIALGTVQPLSDWPAHSGLSLLETSGYRANPDHLAPRFNYVNLIYSGAADGRCIYGDLSDLPLRTESLDFLLTSDVFEHVRRDEPAWENVYRVLKPGGTLLLQVPAVGEMTTTQVRVELRGDEDIHILPPEYHAENTLVYRYYGNDLIPRLRKLGFSVMALRLALPEHCISEQTTIIAQKADYLSLRPAELSDRAWT